MIRIISLKAMTNLYLMKFLNDYQIIKKIINDN